MLTHIMKERNNIISIKENESKIIKDSSPKNEYSLKQHFFDPTKSSSPNFFMLKLQKRMSVYDSFTKDDSCDNK